MSTTTIEAKTAVPAMQLERVVFTGFDDKSSIEAVAEVCNEWPTVEFGVLIARGEFGNPKYPTRECLDKILNYRDKRISAEENKEHKGGEPKKMVLSCHVCNDWAQELVRGGDDIFVANPVIKRFERVQLNFARFLATELNREKLFAALIKHAATGQEFVFQLPSFSWMWLVESARSEGINAYGFFDPSAGMGISPSGGWPAPPHTYTRVGFAGGLGPHNFEAALNTIVKLGIAPTERTNAPSTWLGTTAAALEPLGPSNIGCRRFWVDMETNVRTAGEFDLAKVRICLLIADPFLEPTDRRRVPAAAPKA